MTEPKWHPYPEEKPVEQGNHLVTLSNGSRAFDNWAYYNPKKSNWYNHSDVIAWMPLPPPYIPPVKKKTVRVSKAALLHSIRECFININHLKQPENNLPDFIEIEVDE